MTIAEFMEYRNKKRALQKKDKGVFCHICGIEIDYEQVVEDRGYCDDCTDVAVEQEALDRSSVEHRLSKYEERMHTVAEGN